MFRQLLEIYFAAIAAKVVDLALILCRRHRVFFVYVHPTNWIFYHLDCSPFARLFHSQKPTMLKDSTVAILSFASAITEARWFPNVLGSIVLDKPLNELFRIIVVEDTCSGLLTAGFDNLLNDFGNPAGTL